MHWIGGGRSSSPAQRLHKGFQAQQQAHGGKAQAGVQVQVHQVKKPFGRTGKTAHIGTADGALREPLEGEEPRLLQRRQVGPGFGGGQVSQLIQAQPQKTHQLVGGGGVLASATVAVQEDANDTDVRAHALFQSGGSGGGFRRAGMHPVEVDDGIGSGIPGAALGQLVHVQAVLAVGQPGMAEGKAVGCKKVPAQQASPDNTVVPGGVGRKGAFPGMGSLLLRQFVRELVGPKGQTVAVGFQCLSPESGQTVWGQQIVAVHEPDVVPPGSGSSRIPGGADTGVFLVDDTDIPMGLGIAVGDTGAAVSGAVVHAENLIILNILLQQGIQAAAQIACPIVDRDDDTQKHTVPHLRYDHYTPAAREMQP